MIALLVYPSTLAERARSTADESWAPSPPSPPRLTSRPPEARARHAALATGPKTGSTTTSTAPPAAARKRRPSASVSAVSASATRTTSSAPARAARDSAAADRHTATTRAAPSDRAAAIAACPTVPPAPRTRTRSPGRSPARQVRHIHAAIPDVPIAAASSSATAPSNGHHVVGGHRAGLGQAAVPRSHPGARREPHPRPGRQRRRPNHPADALDPGHVRQRGLPEVRRPARAQQVQRHDRRDGHRDDRRALRRPGASRRPAPTRTPGAGPRARQVEMSGYGRVRCFIAAP